MLVQSFLLPRFFFALQSFCRIYFSVHYCLSKIRLSNLVSILPLKRHLWFKCSIRSMNISNECIQQQNWSQYCVSHFRWRVWRVMEKCSFTYQMKWVWENQPFQPHTDFSTLYWSIGCCYTWKTWEQISFLKYSYAESAKHDECTTEHF